MNFIEAANELRKAIDAQGYSGPVKLSRLAGLKRATDFCEKVDKGMDTGEALKKYYAHLKSRLVDDNITAYQFQNEVKMINFAQRHLRLGNITGNKQYEPRASRYRQPTEHYRNLLLEYEESRSNVYTLATLSCTRASIRDFIFYLEDRGINSISEITRNDMSNYILALSEKYNSNIGYALGRVRIFCQHIASRGLIDGTLTHCLKVRSAKKIKLREGFSFDEVNRIIAAVNKNSLAGKRNYAMLLLGKHTGLRGIDVRELKRKDIDWERKEIHVIQHKTKRPLRLPLENIVGNAIADYIDNVRPDCECENIFVTTSAPFGPLSKAALSGVVKRTAADAGIEWEPHERKGFHSFRHAMATNLLAADVSPDMIAEVLGHASPNSTTPYYSTNSEKLQMCAMPIADFKCSRKELRI
ncbi:MAG: tyrosine-type recombinase/integrase [Oscillospiraceae bacterium]|jgi:integrase|nr:tyrosine-type recombinase/integrase [Oscillospiraceae bacterium]